MNIPKITFGIIVLNGEPFIGYNLRALYPFAHQIIVVEGAAPSAKSIASVDGHSLDNTLTNLRRFQVEEDPENKLTIVIAEDEGHTDGFWPGEKDEMSQAYAKRATGNYLWQIDSDEFYKSLNIREIISMLQNDPTISTVSFRVLSFWGNPSYRTDGFYLQGGAHDFHRLFAWGPGYRYGNHRPPTVYDETGRNLREKNHITAAAMAKRGIFMYHYELLLPKQVREKCNYYMHADWTDTGRGLDQWMNKSYFSLADPFRVHMVYKNLSWLARFKGEHPLQVQKMMDAISKGQFPDIEMRPTADVETLLASWPYIVQRACLKTFVPLNNLRLNFLNALKTFIKKTAIWPYLLNMREQMRGGMVPISIDQISQKLLNGWKDDTIPTAQNEFVSQEIQDMYGGRIIKPYSVLAEAVRMTGKETGEIIEVGCSTGYYYEILRYLLGHDIKYSGIDYSEAMIAEARLKYPGIQFDVGDATSLPLANESCDILISGCVLLHVLDYKKVIAESVRVSKKWVIFHRTPVTNGATSYFKKKAYGVPCMEAHFGEKEFCLLCRENGLVIIGDHVINQCRDGAIKTYLCKRNSNPI